MSRSYLKDSYQKKLAEEKIEKFNANENNIKKTTNPHKYDERPKNRASKEILSKCEDCNWLQEPVNYGGHKVKTSGHRMVSGIVRAKTKQELLKELRDIS